MLWRCEFKMIAFLWEPRKQHLRIFYTRAIPLQHQSAVATAVAIAGSSNNGIRTEIKHYMVGQWHVKVDCVSGFSWKTSSHSEGSNQTVEMIHCMPVGGFQPKVLWSWVFHSSNQAHHFTTANKIEICSNKMKYVWTNITISLDCSFFLILMSFATVWRLFVDVFMHPIYRRLW